jgi:hypothetical protein
LRRCDCDRSGPVFRFAVAAKLCFAL